MQLWSCLRSVSAADCEQRRRFCLSRAASSAVWQPATFRPSPSFMIKYCRLTHALRNSHPILQKRKNTDIIPKKKKFNSKTLSLINECIYTLIVGFYFHINIRKKKKNSICRSVEALRHPNTRHWHWGPLLVTKQNWTHGKVGDAAQELRHQHQHASHQVCSLSVGGARVTWSPNTELLRFFFFSLLLTFIGKLKKKKSKNKHFRKCL